MKHLVLLSIVLSLTCISPCQSLSCYPPPPSPKPKCPPPPPSPKPNCPPPPPPPPPSPPSPPKPECPPPYPTPTPTPPPKTKCPRDTLKLGVCTSWLGLVSGVVGTKPTPACCTLLQGISDLEAAMCLCTAIKANVLGIVHLEMPVAINLVLSGCRKKIPEGFKC